MLDKKISDMQRMISREVTRRLPPIPAGIARLEDHEQPLVKPGVASDGMVLGYDRAKDDWVPTTLGVTDIFGTGVSVVTGPAAQVFHLELVPVVINPPSLTASTGQTITVTIPGLLAGDYVLLISHNANNNSQIFHVREPVCVTPGQADMGQFNPDSVAVDVASCTFYFLVIHRS